MGNEKVLTKPDNKNKNTGVKTRRWGMVVDTRLCIGCNACVAACKAENGTPPGIFWAKVLEEEVGTFPRARRIFWPMRCMQCEEPACLQVCPTGATYQREDNLVLIDANKCTGCKACIMACPYDARSIWNGTSYFTDTVTPYEAMAYLSHRSGTVQKCNFCVNRLDKGLKPYCVANCPTESLIFGDLNDPDSDVNRALGEARRHFRLKEELGTHPSIYYLA